MKIAVCISGQPRFFRDGYSSLFDTFLSKYDCDIFVHSWYAEDVIGKKFDTTHDGSVGKVGTLESNTPSFIIDLYKPKKYLFEPPKCFIHNITFTTENLRNGVNPNGVFSMFYSIKKSIELKTSYEVEHNFKYDVIIRTRFDLKFNELLDLNKFNLKQIHVPRSGNNYVYYDIFAFGDSYVMEHYGGVFLKIENVWNPHKHFIGENILTDGLHSSNISANKIDYKIDIIRE